jgi:hypothetical protein
MPHDIPGLMSHVMPDGWSRLVHVESPAGHHGNRDRPGRLRHAAGQRPAAPHRCRPNPTGTDILLLVQDLHIRVIHAATGELLRDLILDPRKDYQLTGRPPGPPQVTDARTHNPWVRASGMS